MNDPQDSEQLQPIIIVRRGGGHHDEHHGGVWKIAFADFMTAMMAFFLVMWLVNAANEETKAQVASYFNPIKLTDTRAVPKGVRDSIPEQNSEAQDSSEGASEDQASVSQGSVSARATSDADQKIDDADKKQYSEEALFKDPYAVLAEVAGDTGQGESIKVIVPLGQSDVGLNGGDAFRDPFDPAFWQHGPGVLLAKLDQPLLDAGETEMAAVQKLLSQPPVELQTDQPKQSTKLNALTIQSVVPQSTTAGQMKQKTAMTATGMELFRSNDPTEREGDVKPDKAKPDTAEKKIAKGDPPAASTDEQMMRAKVNSVKTELARVIKQSGLAAGPQLSVEGTGEGILVRLTDGKDFSMFSISSAQPSQAMVKMMDQVAGVLKKINGKIIIRGHTDGRPYRSNNYDNWRLSTTRAHMAYHMLVRGGIGQNRFVRIEGYADRALKIKEDPAAAQNRRIEILLQEPVS